MNHIISVANPEKAWCGETITTAEQPFRTLDQVALNGLFPTIKTPCLSCLKQSINALLKNQEVYNDDSN